MSPAPSNPLDPADARRDLESAADLGPGLAPATFAPGRYATAIQRSLAGTHELQLVREASTASLALELDADGAARACRGWRYLLTNDGPEVQTEERFREQAGFRGSYRAHDGAVVVELRRDDEVCAPVVEHARVPGRATHLELRCVLAVPAGHPTLTAPVLVCWWLGPPSPERDALAVPGLGPEGAIVLGAAPGLRVKLDGGLPGMDARDPITLTAVVTAVADDAWASPF